MPSPLKKSKLKNLTPILLCFSVLSQTGWCMSGQEGVQAHSSVVGTPNPEDKPLGVAPMDPAYELPLIEYVEMPLAGETSAHAGAAVEPGRAPPPVQVPKFQGKSIPKAPSSSVIQSPRIDQSCKGCIDVLMGGQVYSDPSVNMVYSYVYSLCLMEWVLQKYLKSQKYVQFKDKAYAESQERALSEVQRILPSYLLAFSLLVNAFKNEDFRKELDALRQRSNAMDNGINVNVPAVYK